jgi:hypothetical protein
VTTTSALGNAIGYLVTAATTAFPEPMQVTEGPMLSDTALTPTSRIWIGYDPTSEGAAGSAEQEFATIAQARSRNETGEIVCCVEYWTGNADNPAATVRAGAFSLLATFEQLLRGSPTTGPGDTTMNRAVLWSQIAGGLEFSYDSDDAGMIGRIVFHVQYMQRLTTT